MISLGRLHSAITLYSLTTLVPNIYINSKTLSNNQMPSPVLKEPRLTKEIQFEDKTSNMKTTKHDSTAYLTIVMGYAGFF